MMSKGQHRHHHHEGLSRRDFLRHVPIGSSLALSLAAGAEDLLAAPQSGTPPYDLVIRGGRVIDPSQSIAKDLDVAVAGGKVVRLAPSLPATSGRQVLSARGKIVTPGLIDVHVHVYDGVAPLAVPADPNCIAKGVTTVVDAGSAGAHTFPGFRKYVIPVVDTRVYALLNISVIGQSSLTDDNPHGELLDLRYANPKVAIRTVEANRDVIVGMKVRLSRDIAGDNDLPALKIAREVSDAVGLPLMAHIGNTHAPLKDILAMLGPRDVVTHSFRARDDGVLDERGKVRPEVRAAVARGVHFDVGHGVGSFSFSTARQAIAQDLLPGTISTDLHYRNVHGPVFDLATTLSKFLHLGLTIEQAIERVTKNPAALFKFREALGTLREGAPADVAVFALDEGHHELVDSVGETQVARRKLVPVATVKDGRIYGAPSIPVVRI